MHCNLKKLYQGYRSLKDLFAVAVLILLISSCNDGLIDSNDKSPDSIMNSESLAMMSNKGANCDNQVNNTEKKLLDCVTLEGVRSHQAALQQIADANGGSRAAFTTGYDESADYVANVLMGAGYSVERQTVATEVFSVSSSTFQQISPIATNYTFDTDYGVMDYSASGDVTQQVTAVDLDLGLGNTSTSGCEASDFVGFPAGNIALIQRGACTFQLKAENAAAAGAVGVIIFNQGNTSDRLGLYSGTLSSAYSGGIPVIETTYSLGAEFASTNPVVRIQVTGAIETVSADNIFAELSGKNDQNVVMAGAALDSPQGTPGINNNGSGASAILETAVKMAKVKPQNTVRFAWWVDNSTTLLGSTEYLNSLLIDELERIALYLNFDVIGSPNYVTFVYDGDDSDGVNIPLAPPAGSDVIEDLFGTYYAGINQPTKAFDLWNSSASQNFLLVGVPSGGIYSGSFEIKSPGEAAIWGGTAGDPYDPCSFLACDTFDNVSLEALEFNSDAAAYAILNTAMNTSLINGEKAKGNFKPKQNHATE